MIKTRLPWEGIFPDNFLREASKSFNEGKGGADHLASRERATPDEKFFYRTVCKKGGYHIEKGHHERSQMFA